MYKNHWLNKNYLPPSPITFQEVTWLETANINIMRDKIEEGAIVIPPIVIGIPASPEIQTWDFFTALEDYLKEINVQQPLAKKEKRERTKGTDIGAEAKDAGDD